ncbi:single-stranded DNA-binding protein [Microbacterium sp. NPDC056569]|uniref:single-stranded DNA-binding protein n=1 Tax=Microbacterium sp. NPDC056569 TaxID=3345867 RepID=UPI00366E61CA
MSDRGDTITITGNVATPPELKHTPAGVAIVTFRVASGQRRYDRDAGAWTDAGTNWYTVSVFRSLAEHTYRSLQKGDRVILTGRLRLREWDNGTRRGTAIEIDAEAIGHDLLWGTTTFVKDSRGAASDTPENWPTTATGDAWAAPGVDGVQAAGEAENSAQPVLVAVGPGAAPSADDDQAPF